MKDIAGVNPISKANEAARLLIINGNLSSSQVSTFTGDILYLLGFAVVFGLIGYFAGRRALSAQ